VPSRRIKAIIPSPPSACPAFFDFYICIALPLVRQPNNVMCLWCNCTFLFCLVYFVNQFNFFLQTTVYSTLWTLSAQSLSNAPRSTAKIQYHHLVILALKTTALAFPVMCIMQQVRIGISRSGMPVKQLDLCSSVSLLLENPLMPQFRQQLTKM
jgi:hypothetical protein